MTTTPGPWRVKASSGCLHVVSDDQMFQTGCISFDGAGEANACLIAAAPDMLEALKGVAFILNCGVMREFDGEPWVGRVRAAIAKAEGHS